MHFLPPAEHIITYYATRGKKFILQELTYKKKCLLSQQNYHIVAIRSFEVQNSILGTKGDKNAPSEAVYDTFPTNVQTTHVFRRVNPPGRCCIFSPERR